MAALLIFEKKTFFSLYYSVIKQRKGNNFSINHKNGQRSFTSEVLEKLDCPSLNYWLLNIFCFSYFEESHIIFTYRLR